jgi:hypothetical protein
MSANRSVQAAQRRRAGPPEPQMPGRAGPQPSINSSQMFSGQSQGQGRSQNAPLQRSVAQSSSGQKGEGINSINKMTVTQAIMLITLRLGAIEQKMIANNMNGSSTSISLEGQENMVLIDRSVIESITNRLESLERRSSTTGTTASGPEISLIKQQMETFRQSIVQTKGTVSKENKELKSQLDTLKQELSETKELLNALQNLTMDNSQKLLAFSLEGDNMDDMMVLPDANSTDFDGSEELHGAEEIMGSDFMGTDLKKLIENEMNSN